MNNPLQTKPTKYDPGVGEWFAIATRLLHPDERRPNKTPGVWFSWRHQYVFVPQDLLPKVVAGVEYGKDLGDMLTKVQTAIKAHKGKPFDMTVAVSQSSVIKRIRRQKIAQMFPSKPLSP